jgi:hypothetical protein
LERYQPLCSPEIKNELRTSASADDAGQAAPPWRTEY